MKTTIRSFVYAAFFAALIYAFYLGYTKDHAHPVNSTFTVVHETVTSTILLAGFAMIAIVTVLSFHKDKKKDGPVVVRTKTIQIEVANGKETLTTIRGLRKGSTYKVIEFVRTNSGDASVVLVLQRDEDEPLRCWFSATQAAWVTPSATSGVTTGRITAASSIGKHVTEVCVAWNSSKNDLILLPQDPGLGAIQMLHGPTEEDLARFRERPPLEIAPGAQPA